MSPREQDFVFNVVWTGGVFECLRYFVCSLMAHSAVRFRFVANACTDESIDQMRCFAEAHPDRVVDVVQVSTTMVSHGRALDLVHGSSHDGPFFSFVDSDIKATGPWMGEFIELLATHEAVTSGKGVWSDEDVVPEGHPGVNGEYFYSRDGFTFGSPHLAMYHRESLDEIRERWGITFSQGGPELPPAIAQRLAERGHDYWVYDTAKITNILLQEDGYRLCHRDLPQLVHVGGMSHYLAPNDAFSGLDEHGEPDWGTWPRMAPRFEVARYAAATLRASAAGRPLPEPPSDLDEDLATRLQRVRHEIVDLVATYRGC